MILFLFFIGIGIAEIVSIDSFLAGNTRAGFAALSSMILFMYLFAKSMMDEQKDVALASITNSNDELRKQVVQLQEHVNFLHDDLIDAYADKFDLEDRVEEAARVLRGEEVASDEDEPVDEDLDIPVRGEEPVFVEESAVFYGRKHTSPC